MNAQALRSASNRLRPDVVAVKSYVRTFTTTSLRAADSSSSSSNDNGTPRQPSGRERSRAAASEIGELLRGGSTARSPQQPSGLPEKPKVIDVKTLPTRGLGGGSNFVKLPSSFRGRGGLGGAQRGARPPSFGGRGGFTMRGRGGPRGGGARGAGRGGRGGRGGRRGGRRGDGELGGDRRRTDRAEDWERFFRAETQEEHAYYQARDQGLPERFEPAVDAKSLLGFQPSLALGDSTPAKESLVLDQLRKAAGNATYSPERWNLTQHTATELANKNAGIHFFSDLEEKKAFVKDVREMPEEQASANIKAIKGSKLESGAEKAVREYILEKAVKGKHTPPVYVEGGKDPMKVAASAHAQNESYGVIEAKKFDAKLASLVARKPTAAAAAANGAKA